MVQKPKWDQTYHQSLKSDIKRFLLIEWSKYRPSLQHRLIWNRARLLWYENRQETEIKNFMKAIGLFSTRNVTYLDNRGVGKIKVSANARSRTTLCTLAQSHDAGVYFFIFFISIFSLLSFFVFVFFWWEISCLLALAFKNYFYNEHLWGQFITAVSHQIMNCKIYCWTKASIYSHYLFSTPFILFMVTTIWSLPQLMSGKRIGHQ